MPQDRTAEQERRPDELSPGEIDEPRDAGVQQDDLRARLERLPGGHPSSPYRDDGSRKPPPAELTELELPLPDELPSEKERTNPDGSWDWKGRHLTPEQSRITDQAIARCRDAEGRDAEGNYGDHGITPVMRRIEAQLDHGALVEDTEKYALKEPNRFKQKVADRIALQPDQSVADIASRIHDGIRYTFEYDETHYTESVYRTEAAIEQQDFSLIIRKPNWDGLEYKGINSQWRDPDSGVFFEVQFHTHESWAAKQKTHLSYEKLADPRTPPREREELEEHQRQIAALVPVPPGALEIPYYRKEGI